MPTLFLAVETENSHPIGLIFRKSLSIWKENDKKKL